eukprot:TRINITY_DN4598_c0_g3_i1.p1 TRINITY_DN4598_c0_g3~~TRINITY_DN4598_c0_g3_i1.p1  ORF type:complete len:690 (-),score=158.09 TRINITY_DN4598_c0_g3_i1:567-2636(-)
MSFHNLDYLKSFTEPKEQKKDPFKNIECNHSLYLFSKESPVRLFCLKTIAHPLFEKVVLITICFISIKLAVDTYFVDYTRLYSKITVAINYLQVSLFTVEGLLKIISLGFMFDKNSYLRSSWNIFDFFIIIVSWMDLTISSVNIPMVRVLRLFRTFKPLRFLSQNVSMRVIVTALFKSLGAIINTLFVILLVWFMFSIVGVSFFAGKFQYCTKDKYENSYKDICIEKGGEWVTYDHNFDNSINGLIFLFVLTTQENWPALAHQAVDCDEEDKGPIKNGRWYYAYYFVAFIFIGAMFLLNLFVGVMFLNFAKAQKAATTSSYGSVLVTEDQLNWIEIQKMIIMAKPNYNIQTLPPEGSWRRPVHNLITSRKFGIFISVIISINLLQLMLLYDSAPDNYKKALNIVNYALIAVFTVEIVLRYVAYLHMFWYDAWNVLDLAIVFTGWADFVYDLSTSDSLLLYNSPKVFRIMRILRITRLLRLFKNHKRLQEIMEVVQLCLPSMINVFSLLALVLFIFAILGCYLFESGKEGTIIDDFYNFNNFGSSMALSFRFATADNWNYFMFDYARTTTSCAIGVGCGNAVAFLYFIAFEFVVTFIMLNLFISVVLELFDKFYFAEGNIISQFKEEHERFQENWLRIGAVHSGYFLPDSKLLRFFERLAGSANLREMDMDYRAREIILMGIRWYFFLHP